MPPWVKTHLKFCLSCPGITLLSFTTGGFSLGYGNACSVAGNVKNGNLFNRRRDMTCHSLCPVGLLQVLYIVSDRLRNPFHILCPHANP